MNTHYLGALYGIGDGTIKDVEKLGDTFLNHGLIGLALAIALLATLLGLAWIKWGKGPGKWRNSRGQFLSMQSVVGEISVRLTNIETDNKETKPMLKTIAKVLALTDSEGIALCLRREKQDLDLMGVLKDISKHSQALHSSVTTFIALHANNGH